MGISFSRLTHLYIAVYHRTVGSHNLLHFCSVHFAKGVNRTCAVFTAERNTTMWHEHFCVCYRKPGRFCYSFCPFVFFSLQVFKVCRRVAQLCVVDNDYLSAHVHVRFTPTRLVGKSCLVCWSCRCHVYSRWSLNTAVELTEMCLGLSEVAAS